MKKRIQNGIAIFCGLIVLTGSAAGGGTDLSGKEKEFQRGVELGRQQMAWIRAAEHRMYLAIWDADRKDELKTHFEDNMWFSIVDLHQFTNNPDAPEEERVAATQILKDLVLYFYTNPKEINIPSGTKLSEKFQEQSKKAEHEIEDAQVAAVFEEMADRSEPMLVELENAFDGMLAGFHKREIMTQRLVDQLIEERFFPGDSIQGAGITLKVPATSSSTSSSVDDVSFESDNLNVSYDAGEELLINEVSYGLLNEGDIVDLRKPGYLFINDTSYTLSKEGHNQSE